MITWFSLLQQGKAAIADTAGTDAVFDAKQLLFSVMHTDATGFLMRQHETPPPEAADKYRLLLDRRQAGEPLQYILGSVMFHGLSFSVGPGVLIPRPETEELTDLAIDALKTKRSPAVFDLCAGSGCIGISIADALPSAEVYLFEKYEGALHYLRLNVPDRLKPRVRILQCDIQLPPPSVPVPDAIVSNPPYIPQNELPLLQKEVRREPETALDGGEDGLIFYKKIASFWLPLLKNGGRAFVECGEGQGDAICRLFSPFGLPLIRKDLYGSDRFVLFEKS